MGAKYTVRQNVLNRKSSELRARASNNAKGQMIKMLAAEVDERVADGLPENGVVQKQALVVADPEEAGRSHRAPAKKAQDERGQGRKEKKHPEKQVEGRDEKVRRDRTAPALGRFGDSSGFSAYHGVVLTWS